MGFCIRQNVRLEVWLLPATNSRNLFLFKLRSVSIPPAGIRFNPKRGKSDFVHTLNGSGLLSAARGSPWLKTISSRMLDLIPEVPSAPTWN